MVERDPKPGAKRGAASAPSEAQPRRYTPVPVFAETLFPLDPHCSVLERGPLPPLSKDTAGYQLILPNRRWLEFIDSHSRKDQAGLSVVREHPKDPRLPARLQYWHSPDYAEGASHGWRDLTIPSLSSFFPLVNSESIVRERAAAVRVGLAKFEEAIAREWTLEELREISPLLRQFDPLVRRGNLRFFFSTDLTADKGLMLTVFLEATDKELKERPPLYKNCNKHLHQSFFTENGLMRRHPEHHGREVSIAASSEHTAYAKYYIRGFNGDGPAEQGLSILMHPAQRSRLGYEPHNDPCYSEIRQTLERLAKFARSRAGYFGHAGRPGAQSACDRISELLHKIAGMARDRKSTLEELRSASAETQALAASLPPDQRLRIRSSAKRRGEVPFRKELRSLLKRAECVWRMHQKLARGHEAEYRIADLHTGAKRELLFLGILDLLKQCFEASGQLQTFRFMLSTEQIARLRLAREDGNVREKISVVPRALEAHAAVTVTRYPLQPVDAEGQVSARWIQQVISTIDLDRQLPTRMKQDEWLRSLPDGLFAEVRRTPRRKTRRSPKS